MLHKMKDKLDNMYEEITLKALLKQGGEQVLDELKAVKKIQLVDLEAIFVEYYLELERPENWCSTRMTKTSARFLNRLHRWSCRAHPFNERHLQKIVERVYASDKLEEMHAQRTRRWW